MFHQIFLSPQVKRRVFISNKQGLYELPHELPNDLKLRILGNKEKKLAKNTEKEKMNPCHMALFHMKSTVCPKYPLNDCRQYIPRVKCARENNFLVIVFKCVICGCCYWYVFF